MSFITKDRIMLLLKILFPVTLLLLVSMEFRDMFVTIDFGLLLKYMEKLSYGTLALIIILGFVALSPMFMYDYYLSKYLSLEIPMTRLIKYSLISNSFSNLLGFGGLIGIALRSYFYKEYEPDNKKLLKGVAFITMFYLTGVSFLTWVILYDSWKMPLIQNHHWLMVTTLVVSAILPILIISYKIKKTNLHKIIKSRKLGLSLLVSSILEWSFIYFYLYWLACLVDLPVSGWDFLKIFLIAVGAGIVSMIPGGIGAFDLVFLWGFEYLGVSTEKLLVVLLLYRIGYYFIPFFTGLILLIQDLWKKWNRYWSNIPRVAVQNVSHFFLTILVFLSGILLLISGAVPGILERLQFTERIISLPVMNFSHHISVGTGLVLLGLARGIEYREKRTYHLTLFVLAIAAVTTFLKGLDYEEAIIIIVVLILLLLSRGKFYRESFVLTWGKIIFDIVVISFFTFGYLLLGYLNMPTSIASVPRFMRPYVIDDAKSLFLSACVALFIALIIILIGYWIKKPKSLQKLSSKEAEAEIISHLEKYNGTTLAHLIFLHDKYIFWNKDKDVLFIYETYADKLVVLGDPVGEEKSFVKAVEELYESADIYGYTPVFYQTSRNMLPILHANGYDFFKLGEEGHVELAEFSLSGKKMKNYRALKNKFDKEGYTVEVSYPKHDPQLLNELENISYRWLGGRKEKGFSLGFFDKDYLNTSRLVYVKDPNGKIISFLSLMPSYQLREMLSIDLMRSLPGSPSGSMDYLYLHTFEYLKEAGVVSCNLGMAPLSNLSLSRFSFMSEKIADQIFKHGHVFYHFQGLKNFKNKYCDTWEPKYLGYRRKSSLPFTSAQVTMLVAKSKRN